MEPNPKNLYGFNGFQLDIAERVLMRGGRPVPVPPKVLDVLVTLVENHGHIVSKEMLLNRVWAETFVEESAIAQSIFTLRKLLGDTAEGHAYIETVPRRGYRFVAPVEIRDEPVSPDKVQLNDDAVKTARPHLWPIVAVVVIVVATVVASQAWRRTQRNPSSAAKIMLAVLPFENLSGDSQQDYLSAGLTEEMITQLAILEPDRLGVIARTSAMQFKGTKKSAQKVGQELQVDYLLEGSVRQDGERVRITAQLIQVKDQTPVWAKDYDRDRHDILLLQTEVAGAIAREIDVKLTSQGRARLSAGAPVDPETYELYLKGRYFWDKRTQDGYLKAIRYFQQAIVRDPKYAQAYAGLADTYALLGSLDNVEVPRDEAMTKAKAAALNALHLDDSLAEAHTSLAFVMMQYEWDWRGSEQEFKRAIELNPSYATAHQWYAIWLMAQRKSSQALEEESRAQQSDPLSPIIKTDTAQLLECGKDYVQAVQQVQRALEIDPNFSLAHLTLADAYVGKQDYAAATAEFQVALAAGEDNPWVLSHLARSYALAGEPHKSEVILRDLLKSAKNQNDVATELGTIYAALGKNDQAFFWLEKAYQHHSGSMILFGVSPEYQSLHGDPRFTDLLHRVGLPAE